jgi:hypothetical protein
LMKRIFPSSTSPLITPSLMPKYESVRAKRVLFLMLIWLFYSLSSLSSR